MSEQGIRDPWDHRFHYWTDAATVRAWQLDAWKSQARADVDFSHGVEPPNAHQHKPPNVLIALDWLDHSPEALADLLALVAETSHLTWCLLSERPMEWADKLRAAHFLMKREFATYADSEVATIGHWLRDLAPTPPPNVYVGTTVTTQAEADERIPELLSIPARVRVLRVSPREPLDLSAWTTEVCECYGSGYDGGVWDPHPVSAHGDGIGWVVCEGGDTPMHPEWVRSLRDQAEEAGVPFWFSGWGEWVPAEAVAGSAREFWLATSGTHDRAHVYVGKDKAGRLLDGREWSGVPS